MLSTIRTAALRRIAARRVACFSTEAGDENADISPAGIDRSNPLYAPSYRREWKHEGYSNIANEDNPAEWKEWSDLPAPYKYYHVKVDPADVENHGMIWQLANNWKTCIPLALGLSIPLFAFDVIVVDSHMELAAIFWTSIAMAYKNAGDAIRGTLEEENIETKKQLYGAEAEYFNALQENIDVHQKATGLPTYIKMLNDGERALRKIEADAASTRNRAAAAGRMTEMLEYLVATQGSEAAGADDSAVVAAQLAVDAKLSSDKASQQASIADAIAALKTGGGTMQAGNTTEGLFTAAYTAHVSNPPKPDASVAAAEKEREAEIFNKRFGFVAGASDPNPMDFVRS